MKQMKFNKTWAFSLVLTALLCTALTYALVQVHPYVHRDPQLRANVFVITETAAGRSEFVGGNVITNLWETNLRNTYAFYNDVGMGKDIRITMFELSGLLQPFANALASFQITVVVPTTNLPLVLGGFAVVMVFVCLALILDVQGKKRDKQTR